MIEKIIDILIDCVICLFMAFSIIMCCTGCQLPQGMISSTSSPEIKITAETGGIIIIRNYYIKEGHTQADNKNKSEGNSADAEIKPPISP